MIFISNGYIVAKSEEWLLFSEPKHGNYKKRLKFFLAWPRKDPKINSDIWSFSQIWGSGSGFFVPTQITLKNELIFVGPDFFSFH